MDNNSFDNMTYEQFSSYIDNLIQNYKRSRDILLSFNQGKIVLKTGKVSIRDYLRECKLKLESRGYDVSNIITYDDLVKFINDRYNSLSNSKGVNVSKEKQLNNQIEDLQKQLNYYMTQRDDIVKKIRISNPSSNPIGSNDINNYNFNAANLYDDYNTCNNLIQNINKNIYELRFQLDQIKKSSSTINDDFDFFNGFHETIANNNVQKSRTNISEFDKKIEEYKKSIIAVLSKQFLDDINNLENSFSNLDELKLKMQNSGLNFDTSNIKMVSEAAVSYYTSQYNKIYSSTIKKYFDFMFKINGVNGKLPYDKSNFDNFTDNLNNLLNSRKRDFLNNFFMKLSSLISLSSLEKVKELEERKDDLMRNKKFINSISIKFINISLFVNKNIHKAFKLSRKDSIKFFVRVKDGLFNLNNYIKKALKTEGNISYRKDFRSMFSEGIDSLNAQIIDSAIPSGKTK